MSYTLPLPESHFITLAKAKEMTALYRNTISSVLKEEYAAQDLLPYSETFNIGAFQGFFNNPSCAGIRAYFGMSEDYKTHLIFVGVNENGEDILPTASENSILAGDEKIVEEGKRCPPYCTPVLL